MPYIEEKRRSKIWDNSLRFGSDNALALVHANNIETRGDLNYAISMLLEDFAYKLAKEAGREKPGYSQYQDVVGTVECAKLEFYRRVVAPYEDVKIKDNGDVFRRE